MVPCANAGTPLWAHSVLDVAAGHDVTYEISCKRFLAHRHSQNLLEAFFVGDFATSKARIPTDKSLIMIVLQAFFFFLPGTFCEVMPISSLLKEQTTANADYNSRVDRDVVRPLLQTLRRIGETWETCETSERCSPPSHRTRRRVARNSLKRSRTSRANLRSCAKLRGIYRSATRAATRSPCSFAMWSRIFAPAGGFTSFLCPR